MLRVAASLAAIAFLAALAAGGAGARPAAVPRGCQLLTQQLVQAHFH